MAAYDRRTLTGGAVATTLTAGITSGDTTIAIAASTGWPTGSTGNFFVVIARGLAAEEKIEISTRTSLSLAVVTRGADGTTAAAHSSGDAIEICLTARDLDEANVAANKTVGKATAAGQILVVDAANSFAAVQAKTSGQILVGSGSTLASVAVSGDATLASSGALTIANDAVSYAKLQNSATDRLLGRDTAGTGDHEELTVGGGIEFTGSGGIQRSALTGAVTASAGSGTTAFATGTIPTLIATSAPSGVAGQLWYDTDDNLLYVYNGTAWVCITPVAASASGTVTTTSSSYTALSGNPAVSIQTGTKALVTVGCKMFNDTLGQYSYMGFAVSGATTVAAQDATQDVSAYATDEVIQSGQVYVTGLTAGVNTFTANYKRVSSGTSSFSKRQISVVGIP